MTEQRAPGDRSLLHELEGQPAADAQHRPPERQPALAERPAAHLVHREFHNDDILRIYREISEFMRYLAPRVWLLIGRDRSKYPRDKVEQALRELNIR